MGMARQCSLVKGIEQVLFIEGIELENRHFDWNKVLVQSQHCQGWG